MNLLAIIGLCLGAGLILVNRMIRPIPRTWLAIALYCLAVILIIAGMILSKRVVG